MCDGPQTSSSSGYFKRHICSRRRVILCHEKGFANGFTTMLQAFGGQAKAGCVSVQNSKSGNRYIITSQFWQYEKLATKSIHKSIRTTHNIYIHNSSVGTTERLPTLPRTAKIHSHTTYITKLHVPRYPRRHAGE